jgi:hypothetical protein
MNLEDRSFWRKVLFTSWLAWFIVGVLVGRRIKGFGITTNIAQVMARLSKIEKQIPYAQSKALNDTAFQIRQQIVQRTYPDSFTVRNTRFINSVLRVETAKKTNLNARVYDKLGRDYLERQAKGGVKTPKGSNLAIPGVRNMARTAGGAIRKADRPRSLINRKDVFKTPKAIMQRQKGQPLKVLYILEPSANIPKRFPFYEDASKVANTKFKVNYKSALSYAMRTAR